jgi:hypothetical protein
MSHGFVAASVGPEAGGIEGAYDEQGSVASIAGFVATATGPAETGIMARLPAPWP